MIRFLISTFFISVLFVNSQAWADDIKTSTIGIWLRDYLESAMSGGRYLISDDFAHIAWASKTENKKMVAVIDGESQPSQYESIAYMAIGPNGKQHVYAAKQDGKWFVIYNGKEIGPKLDDIKDLKLSPNGKRFAYSGKIGDKWVVVIDGNIQGEYEEVKYPEHIVDFGSGRRYWTKGLKWSLDSSQVEFIVKRGDKYDSIKIQDKTKQVNLKMDNISQCTDNFVYSPDGKHWGCRLKLDDGQAFMVDGKRQQPYPSVDFLVFSKTGGHSAYKVWGKDEKNEQFMVINGIKQKTYKGIDNNSFVFSDDGKKWAYVATAKENKDFVVINGVETKEFKSIGQLRMTYDGSHIAYKVWDWGDNQFIMIDNIKQKSYSGKEGIVNDSFVFSPKGKHWAYVEIIDNGDKNRVVTDTGLGQELDRIAQNQHGQSLSFLDENTLSYFAAKGNLLELITRVEHKFK
jgi:hypothetical protein